MITIHHKRRNKANPLTNRKEVGIISIGRLYSIPEPNHQGLEATEYVCTLSREEEHMDKDEGGLVRRPVDWLNKYHLVVVILLSAMHIGLACIHTRDSGRAALTPSLRVGEAVPASIEGFFSRNQCFRISVLLLNKISSPQGCLTTGSTGAAQASFVWFCQCYVPHPVNRGVRQPHK